MNQICAASRSDRNDPSVAVGLRQIDEPLSRRFMLVARQLWWTYVTGSGAFESTFRKQNAWQAHRYSRSVLPGSAPPPPSPCTHALIIGLLIVAE
ncbi:hypothetical protein DACRYDRAFT_21891 [Dacryopinax primogenitus]|uniref:Uncharacterized protein n=1 Tax=Dacryopinax primogenitus (strain DJM 731) TaxID=1858805 RepID=M5GD33_DACPD|nr:uncharacterized protein DACRYDRAFT_21891 [Dacryopinax primogenitus]EJU02118.1 hypothetical protein DACRYDRAFT_21891 [Dacryopinax primogenitus]